MKYPLALAAFTLTATLAACTSAGEAYAKKHPELTPAQVLIFTTGKIPDGTAVAGLTREQVQLAMGVEPAQYIKVDGHDAWVYVTRKLGTSNLNYANDALFDHQDNRSRHSLTEGESHAPEDQPIAKTTVVFDGERAVRAEVVNPASTPQ